MNWTAHTEDMGVISSDEEARMGNTIAEMEEKILFLNEEIIEMKKRTEKEACNVSVRTVGTGNSRSGVEARSGSTLEEMEEEIVRQKKQLNNEMVKSQEMENQIARLSNEVAVLMQKIEKGDRTKHDVRRLNTFT